MLMTIQERVDALRKKMAKRGLEAYIVPTSDPHQSESVPEFYKTREFISGFTGSAGTAIITMKECGLWTDGRYFLQAGEELKAGPFKLYRMGTEDETEIEFLKNRVSAFGKIGFDGMCMATSTYMDLAKSLGKRMLVSDVDYIGDIWENRPELPKEAAYEYPVEFSGKSVSEKLEIIRYMMKDRHADYTFIGALEDVCYLYNIRGWDVDCTPVVLSYALISQDEAYLFIDMDKVTPEIEEPLRKAGVQILPYGEEKEKLSEIPGQKIVYLEPDRVNIYLYHQLNNNVKIHHGINFTSLMKAIKNDVEIENEKKAYIKDGVALVKFFYWVETGAGTGTITEQVAVEKLHRFREELPDFIEDSFDAIIGYGANAAIVHHNPMTSKTPTRIETSGLLLVDSGGHYLQGTTDTTRTYAMGPTTYEENRDYTLVLKSHIAGMTARFPSGTRGSYVDALAKQPLYNEFLNYNHGTGHGVGHMLCVHEGPQGIRYNNDVELVPGMMTSMEPGLYITNRHGIRIESITLCVESEKNEFGQFLEFESLTWAPLDTRPVLIEMMTKKELDWLNQYNKTCYEKLSPYLSGEELKYLEERCQAIG